VELDEKAAEALGVKAGHEVRVEGNGYELTLPVKTAKGMRGDVAFIPEGFPGVKVEKFFASPLTVPIVRVRKT